MNTIYAYSTDTYLDKNWIKVGETSLSADERIAQQDTTSNPEQLKKLQEWKVPNRITDKKIHKHLESRGFFRTRDDKDREWFEVPLEEVAKAINELHHGVARPNNYAPREEQVDCIRQASKWFIDGGSEFLINAKMRYGKTFVSYQIIKELQYKKVLVLTYKPAVKDGWNEDLENHVDFDGWKYFNNLEEFKKNRKAKTKVLFASFQDMNQFGKDKWIGIDKVNFDMIIIDEMHFGADTHRAKKTLTHLNCNRTLFVSGTPLDALVSGRFDDENTYSWTYSDEQRKRRSEQENNWETEIYRWLPQMSIHTFEVSDEAKQQCLSYTEEEQFTMTKMFASDDGAVFNDESAVKLWLDQVFGFGVRKTKSPIRTFAPDHSLWVMPPNVNSVNALSNYLKRYPATQGYEIINVAGNNISSLTKVKKLIAKNDKTITITCGRFNTGTTVPEWDAVFMLGDGSAPETYFQTIFRAQSSDKSRMKEQCHVFDFNPERVLELVYSYSELTAKKTQTTNSNVREFLDFCPVLDHTDNKVRTIDAEEVVLFVSESGGFVDKFTSNYLFEKSNALQFSDLLHLDGSVKNVTKKIKVANSELDIGKNYLNNNNGTKHKSVNTIEKEIMDKAKVVTKKIPAYVLWVDRTESTEQLLNTDKKEFEEHFEISRDLFEQMVEDGFINRDRLDRYIGAVINE